MEFMKVEGNRVRKKKIIFPTKANISEYVDWWIGRVIEVHEHETTMNKGKLKRYINVYSMQDNSTMNKENKKARVVFN